MCVLAVATLTASPARARPQRPHARADHRRHRRCRACSTIPTDPVRQTMYKSLMSELGVVIAPRALSPADTLGYSGFQLAFETSFTQISNTQDFWQKGVENVSGSFLPTISVMARKGIWLPLPGFEIGAGATKLLDSNMYAVQGYAKLALHEGFHDWAIPSLALRGAVSHLLGSSQVDLTVISIDATVSKSFGIGGTVTLDPVRRRRHAARHRARPGHRHDARRRRVRRRQRLQRRQRQHDVPRSGHDRPLAHLRRLPPRSTRSSRSPASSSTPSATTPPATATRWTR